MEIYVIKQFRITENDMLESCGNVGFYIDLHKAIDVVENNLFDLSEDGYYEYSAIMKISEGLYQTAQEEYWYHWDYDKYVECDRPEEVSSFTFML